MDGNSVLPQQPGRSSKHTRSNIGSNEMRFWVIILGIIFVLFSLLCFLFVKAGFIQFPILSRFYTEPKPTRIIETPKKTLTDFKNLLETRLLLAQLSAQNSDTLRIAVTETELSSVLQDSIYQAISDQGSTVIERIQVVILNDQMELVAFIRRNGIRVHLLIRFRPIVDRSLLTFEPTYFQLGDVPLPVSIAQKFIALIFSRDFGTWDIHSELFRVDEVELHEGTIVIVLRRTSR
ncbi:hypothetical protein IT408_01155 [Candidatus Uhrbacteria bacterium]|nr:hypothetical protein [Candidatus Uhrbacteria bacterium]